MTNNGAVFVDSCPACFFPLVVSFRDAAPASDLLQDAFGGDVAALYRFFDESEWLKQWSLPLTLTWGTSAEWKAIAAVWRETRARREGRFLSLEEINARWSGGEDER